VTGFEIVGEVEGTQTFASGRQIRELDRLKRTYGKGDGASEKAWREYAFPMEQ
jgi:hypothetical protein